MQLLVRSISQVQHLETTGLWVRIAICLGTNEPHIIPFLQHTPQVFDEPLALFVLPTVNDNIQRQVANLATN